MSKHFDIASLLVIAITFVLFAVALVVKGLTRDLLLEAGVLLVSVKLIMMAHKSGVGIKAIKKELAEIKALVKQH